MDARSLEKEVLNIVQDSSYEGRVLPFLNRGLLEVAKRFNLASLDASQTINCLATQDQVDLPDDYMKTVYFVSDGKNRIGRPSLYYNLGLFLQKHPDRTIAGPIVDVAINNAALLYTGREDKDLTIRYFTAPVPLVKNSDKPICIPEHLQEPILVNYAAWKIYDLIEDGIEGKKTNTNYYFNLYMMNSADLEMYSINLAEPEYIQDTADGIWS